jgi:hypothetical protein
MTTPSTVLPGSTAGTVDAGSGKAGAAQSAALTSAEAKLAELIKLRDAANTSAEQDDQTTATLLARQSKADRLTREAEAARKEVEAIKEKEAKTGPTLLDKTKSAVGTTADIATTLALLKMAFDPDKPDAPATQSAGDAYRELSGAAADPLAAYNRELTNYGGTFGNFGISALEDPRLRAAWEADNRPPINEWLQQQVMDNPTGESALIIRDMLAPYNVEAKERGMRTDEAADWYNNNDASQFQSPEMRAAQAYASGLANDPLSMQNREYISNELTGEYSPEFYTNIREQTFKGIDPSMQATSYGLGKALIGAEGAVRDRRDSASDRATRYVAGERAYAPSYASIAASGSVDPLSLSNVGKMGIGNIEPMDPTGAFFSSFPAREDDALMAAWGAQPSMQDRVTAFQAASDEFQNIG